MADEEEKDNMIQCTKELKFYKAHGEGQGFDGTVFHGVFVLLCSFERKPLFKSSCVNLY